MIQQENIPTKSERSPLIPFPKKGDKTLFLDDIDFWPAIQLPMDNETGFVEWMLTDVRHGFHIYQDDELELLLDHAAQNNVNWMYFKDDVIIDGGL